MGHCPYLLDDLWGHSCQLSQIHGLASALCGTETKDMQRGNSGAMSGKTVGNEREKGRDGEQGLTATLGCADGTAWGTMSPA